jgi:dihydrodipicolinate synthase/N-acetylneuraminate lyase
VPASPNPDVVRSRLEGVIPILVTPFREDESIDTAGLDNQVDHLVSAGVRMVAIGYGSEVHRMGPDEVFELVAHVVRHADGRLGVVGNADASSTQAGIAAVRRMRSAGAWAALLRPSGLGGVPQDDIVRSIAEIATAGKLPIIVQDAPQHTGADLSADALAQLLLEIDEVVGVKIEPTAPAPKMSRIIEALNGADAVILGGAGGQDYVHELQRGAAGTMPGPAFPEIFLAVDTLFHRGDESGAARTLARVIPLLAHSSRSMDTFLYQQKHILKRAGVLPSTRLRTPHTPLDARLPCEIDDMLRVLDFDALVETSKAIGAQRSRA